MLKSSVDSTFIARHQQQSETRQLRHNAFKNNRCNPQTPAACEKTAAGAGGDDQAACERGSSPDEGKVAPEMVDKMVLLRQLSTKVNQLEKAVTPRGTPVSPEQPLRRSVFRQAMEEGGSLGMQQMHVDELGGGQVGVGSKRPVNVRNDGTSTSSRIKKRFHSTRPIDHRRCRHRCLCWAAMSDERRASNSSGKGGKTGTEDIRRE
ncbi:unnamed protein product [Phytophthora lilii]|uniref:Unnamed protein product n=1 Tax=Phytophthora lilii TaxID=2077276 RepID=A0A9W6TP87_9STRA|nr:unnamed protein product [Phytophthora lilii]